MNRLYSQFRYSLEKQVVDLYMEYSVGAAGAPTIVAARSKGVSSIARNSAGKYTITLGDKYYSLLAVYPTIFRSTGVGAAAPNFSVVTEDVDGAKTIQVLFQNGGVDTDPASGEVIKLQISLKRSNAL